MKPSTIAQNNKGISVTGERLVVVGGTQGIGAGVARKFAEAGAEVWIVGRNEAKANEVLEKLRAASAALKIEPPPAHTFLQADLSLVSGAKRLAQDIRTRAGEKGIDYLVMTQGGPPNGKYALTSEGYEQHFAVQVLSRFIIAQELAGDPASSTVKKAVMSIMAPGKAFGIAFDADDLNLKEANSKGKYGLFMAMARDSVVVDAFTDDLVKGNPNVSFTHVYPGTVKTDVARNSALPWHLSLVVAVGAFMGLTTQQYAELPFYLLAHPEGRTLARRDIFIDEKFNKCNPHASFGDADVREKIRSSLLDIMNSDK